MIKPPCQLNFNAPDVANAEKGFKTAVFASVNNLENRVDFAKTIPIIG
jgi:hypothetical protein